MIKKLKKKDVKVSRLVKCARQECEVKFPEKSNKKFCSNKCQWKMYNEKHPIVRVR